MSYRLMAAAWAAALALTVYNLARDVLGPGAWRG
jgi:hypothetical protein